MSTEQVDFVLNAHDRTRAAFEQARGSLRGLGESVSSVRGMMATLGGILGVTSFGALIKGAADTHDELGKMSQRVGVSVESLSALKYAGGLADVSLDALGTGLKQLSKSMVDAQAGTGDAQVAFRALGVTVTDQNGRLKATEEQFLELADKFAGMEDGAGKTALAMKVFGRAGADLIPMLNQGRAGLAAATEEARRLGVVISDEASKSAEALNDNLQRLTSVLEGMRNELAKEVIPKLTGFTEQMLAAQKASTSFWQSLITFMRISGAEAENPLAAIDTINTKLAKLHADGAVLAGDSLGARLNRMVSPEDLAIIQSQIAALEQQKKALQELLALRVQGNARGLAEDAAGNVGPAPALPKPPGLPDLNADREAERVARQLQEGEEEWAKVMAEASAATAAFRASELAAEKDFEDRRIQALIEAYEREQEMAIQQGQTLLIGSGMAHTVRLEELRRQFLTDEEIATEEFTLKLERLAQFSEAELAQFGGYAALRERLEAEHQAKLGNAAAQGALQRMQLQKMTAGQQAQFYFGHLANITAGAAQHNKSMFELNKMAGIANAVISANEGAAKALEWGWPLGPIFAGIIWAAAAVNIAAIRATQFGSTTSAPSIGAGGATPVTPAYTPTSPAALPAPQDLLPGAGRAREEREMNVTIVARPEQRVTYGEVVEDFIPLIEQAVKSGATRMNISFVT